MRGGSRWQWLAQVKDYFNLIGASNFAQSEYKDALIPKFLIEKK